MFYVIILIPECSRFNLQIFKNGLTHFKNGLTHAPVIVNDLDL